VKEHTAQTAFDYLSGEIPSWITEELGWPKEEISSLNIEAMKVLTHFDGHYLHYAPLPVLVITVHRGQEQQTMHFFQVDSEWIAASKSPPITFAEVLNTPKEQARRLETSMVVERSLRIDQFSDYVRAWIREGLGWQESEITQWECDRKGSEPYWTVSFWRGEEKQTKTFDLLLAQLAYEQGGK
jgi:hypothetical protein